MNIFSVIAFFHSISDALQVTHTPERGRFVVASRDIEVGECLIHEEAIVNLVRSKCSLSHCYNCQKNTRLRPVPCLRCAAVVFCSVQCRSKSEARYILIYIRYESSQEFMYSDFWFCYFTAIFTIAHSHCMIYTFNMAVLGRTIPI